MFLKRKCLIKKAIKETVATFAERTPKIYNHFFYGKFDIDPRNLVVWYLFETDAELVSAKLSGLCAELKEDTIKNLISFGYPKEAFEPAETAFSADTIVVHEGSEEDIQKLFDSLKNINAKVSFTTQEDIDKKANGDFHLYFQ